MHYMTIVGLFLFWPITGLAQTQGKYDLGRLHLVQKMIQIGSVHRGKKVDFKVPIENRGRGPLALSGTYSDCGCIITDDLTGVILQPGEIRDLHGVLDTTHFEGKLKKRVSVIPAGRKKTAKAIYVTANIYSNVDVNPPLVDFGSGTAATFGGSGEVGISISSSSHQFDVDEIVYDKERFSVTWVKVAQDRINLRIGLQKFIPGLLKDVLVVKTNHPVLKEIPIPVRAQILPEVNVQPLAVQFDTLKHGGRSTKTIAVYGDQIEGAEVVDASVRVGRTQISDGKSVVQLGKVKTSSEGKLSVQIEFAHPGGAHRGNVTGEVTLKVLPSNHVEKLKIYGMLQ